MGRDEPTQLVAAEKWRGEKIRGQERYAEWEKKKKRKQDKIPEIGKEGTAEKSKQVTDTCKKQESQQKATGTAANPKNGKNSMASKTTEQQRSKKQLKSKNKGLTRISQAYAQIC